MNTEKQVWMTVLMTVWMSVLMSLQTKVLNAMFARGSALTTSLWRTCNRQISWLSQYPLCHSRVKRRMPFTPLPKEALIYSHIAATVAWRDEMQGVARSQGLFSQGLFSLTSGTTRQFARQAPSRRACFARYQRGACGQIGGSRVCTAWCQSPGYDLRRTRRDLPDLTRKAALGGINQRFPNTERRLPCKPCLAC